jgi:hypothetical protein
MLRAGKHLPLSGTSSQPGRELEVRFSYNRTFGSNKTSRQAGSWTKNMRPDYTLSMWPLGFTEAEAEAQELMVHVHFDAKYRLEQAADLLSTSSELDASHASDEDPEQDTIKQAEASGTYKRADLLKMHAYRDAIRRSHGAYVVYPGDAQNGEPFQIFHEVLPGLGAFALRPGKGTEALQIFLRDVVAHVCDRTSARERQSYQTYTSYQAQGPQLAEDQRALYKVVAEKTGHQRHTPPADTAVLLGWYKDATHLQWIKNNGKYNFRLGNTAGALRLTPQIVGAQYLMLHGPDGAALPGLFRISQPDQGPSLVSNIELSALGYPTPPTRPAYVVFNIEPAVEFEGYGWSFRDLPNLPSNVNQGYPFATDLAALLQVAKVIPL